VASRCVQASHERYEQLLAQTLYSNAALSKAVEDAGARDSVFDETVKNLVKAKMQHAVADASVRNLRDEVETLRAASTGGGKCVDDAGMTDGGKEGSPGSQQRGRRPWPRGVAGATLSPESSVGKAVTKSSSLARNALTGLSAFFTPTKGSSQELTSPSHAAAGTS
jgi:hypothetical protein